MASIGSCCCSWGSAVAGEWPEFGCAHCPRHQAGLGELPAELCKRHAAADKIRREVNERGRRRGAVRLIDLGEGSDRC